MELTIYDIIRGPVTSSSKAHLLNKKFNKLMVYVHEFATKNQIKEAVEKLFNVRTKKINTLRLGDKSKRVGQHVIVRSGKRKAIITLEKGYSVNLFNQAGTSDIVLPESQMKNSEN